MHLTAYLNCIISVGTTRNIITLAVLHYRLYSINGDKRYYIIGESFITLTVISVLQYRLVNYYTIGDNHI